jgi:hypothetical protein
LLLLFTPQKQSGSANIFCCYFAIATAEVEDFCGADRAHGCSFAAFNSVISERCSILCTNTGSSRIAAGRQVWVIGFAVFRARLNR